MLLSLNIKNFAVFEDVSVNFDAGVQCFHGGDRVRKIRVNQCYTASIGREGIEGPDKKGQKVCLG